MEQYNAWYHMASQSCKHCTRTGGTARQLAEDAPQRSLQRAQHMLPEADCIVKRQQPHVKRS